MSKKLTAEFVRERFDKEGYVLLTEVYKNAFQKLDYVCPNGHQHSIKWNDWQQGHRCPYCVGVVKKDINLIKFEFEEEGYKFLTKKYVNVFQKLDYICPKGHKHSISCHNWQRGQRCPYCAGQGKPTIEFIRSEFEKEGYVLLDDVYINSRQKLSYTCPQDHKHNVSWDDWQQGRRCPYCNIGKKGNNIKLAIESIRSEFEKEGYILLTTVYVNCSQKLKYICPNGHQHSIIWGSWQRGRRCPICANIKMSGENNPNWKGGIACDPYCDAWADKEYKESIKERDNHVCQNPDCWKKNGEASALNIHHIDYNKKSCGPDNLITVCRSCNSRANKDRKWHTAWYQTILNKRYGYKYKSSKTVGETTDA
jgi:hypothetical protein